MMVGFDQTIKMTEFLHLLGFTDCTLNIIHFIATELRSTENDSICVVCYQHTDMDSSIMNQHFDTNFYQRHDFIHGMYV
jgi:hypothetical protein